MPNYKALLNRGLTKPWYKKFGNYFTRKNRTNTGPQLDSDHYGTNTLKQFGPEELPPVSKVGLNFKGTSNRGVILANSGNAKNKRRIFEENFEQKFIKENLTRLTKIVDGAGQISKIISDFRERLTNPGCSEIEAVYLYNHLLCMFILLNTSILLFSLTYTSSSNLDTTYSSIAKYAAEFNVHLPSIKPKIKSFSNLVSAYFNFFLIVPGILSAGAMVAVTGLTGNPLAALAVALPFGLLVLNIKRVTGNMFFKKLAYPMMEIYMLIFSPANTIKVNDVKGKISFWGLNEASVDFMFSHARKIYADGYVDPSREFSGIGIIQSYDLLMFLHEFYYEFLRNLGNRDSPVLITPFTEDILKDIITYSDTMYNITGEEVGQRPQIRGDKRYAMFNKSVAADGAENPGVERGGSRRRRRRQKRKTRR